MQYRGIHPCYIRRPTFKGEEDRPKSASKKGLSLSGIGPSRLREFLCGSEDCKPCLHCSQDNASSPRARTCTLSAMALIIYRHPLKAIAARIVSIAREQRVTLGQYPTLTNYTKSAPTTRSHKFPIPSKSKRPLNMTLARRHTSKRQCNDHFTAVSKRCKLIHDRAGETELLTRRGIPRDRSYTYSVSATSHSFWHYALEHWGTCMIGRMEWWNAQDDQSMSLFDRLSSLTAFVAARTA